VNKTRDGSLAWIRNEGVQRLLGVPYARVGGSEPP
jgi:hypothetical protein